MGLHTRDVVAPNAGILAMNPISRATERIVLLKTVMDATWDES
jgi:hypothetical protein